MSTKFKQFNSPTFTRTEATATLWRRGNLTWKIDETQQKIYSTFQNQKGKISVWMCSRRLGKSYLLLIVALEQCLRKAGSVVKYLAPEQKQVRTILRSLMYEIMGDCPEDIAPQYRRDDSLFRFPNGSEIQLAGCDGKQYESLRGGKADLCIVDEAGFVDELKYIVNSVLLPTTLSTNGRIILSSTPPRSISHEFVDGYVRPAIASDNIIKFTVYECPRYTKEQIQDMADACGGVESIEFRREYLCELITDDKWQVVPEFTMAVKQQVVKDWKRPSRFDSYVGMDIGFQDLTVVLFGYWDFRNSKLIIEDELVMNGPSMTTDKLAENIRAKETMLFTDTLSGELVPPYLRVSDHNPILLNDLRSKHGIMFAPAQKDESDASLNNMRIMLGSHQIIINPRCRTLVMHLENAVWAPSRKTYKRVDGMGHFDAVDALKYMCRHIQTWKNPYPYGFDHGPESSWHYTADAQKKSENPLKRLFIRKK